MIDPQDVEEIKHRRSVINKLESKVASTLSAEFGDFGLRMWEDGFETAVMMLKRRGATDIASDLERTMDQYWRDQGVMDGLEDE